MGERLSRELMALRVAAELRPREVVNLGIGMPTLVANFVPEGRGVVFHSENGILGYGIHAAEGSEDVDLINARAEHVTWQPGGAAISHTDAFSIVRSGRLDVAVLGGLQVSERGDLANWMVPSARALGVRAEGWTWRRGRSGSSSSWNTRTRGSRRFCGSAAIR